MSFSSPDLRRVAIVEDEESFRNLFSGYIARYAEENKLTLEVTAFPDGLDILDDFRSDFDIILLDIQMPHLDGMKTARLIRQHDANAALIFITTLAQYAIKGYEVDALDYILKPVTYEQFALRFRKAVQRTAPKEASYLFLPTEDGKDRVAVDSILYMDVDHHTLRVHTLAENGTGKKYEMRKPIGKMEEELAGLPFFRCDQSVLVNLRHITRVGKDTVQVGDAILPVSRSRRKDFLNALADQMEG